MQTLSGTVEFVGIECGVWRVKTASGESIPVVGLPVELCQPGIQVELEGHEEAAVGIAMMGMTFVVSKGRRI